MKCTTSKLLTCRVTNGGPIWSTFYIVLQSKIKQHKSVGVLIVCHFFVVTVVTWQVTCVMVQRFHQSSETKPRPKSWPTLSIVWRRPNCPHLGVYQQTVNFARETNTWVNVWDSCWWHVCRCRNIFSIQQCLTNITSNRESDLDHARQYYELLYLPPDVSYDLRYSSWPVWIKSVQILCCLLHTGWIETRPSQLTHTRTELASMTLIRVLCDTER